jgi:anaerobic magnesium-protoporphyrin IX monomethyl ester cyclase
MRVLFIFPDLASDITNYTGVTSYGVTLLSALCKREGIETDLLHITIEPTRESFREKIQSSQPDLIAFSTNSHYARRLPEWTVWAAEDAPGVPIAVGGVHATLVPDEVIELPHVTHICIGEGEDAFLELCHALDKGQDTSKIRNLWVKVDGQVIKNEQRALVSDLDSLPDPDYGLFDFANLYPVRRGLFPFIMSRGCAFRCTYCSVHALRNLSPGGTKFWRFPTPLRTAEQLRDMIGRHQADIKKVQFLDAILFPNLRWLKEFAPLYKELVGLPFSCNMRADFVTDEVAAIMADMGCEIVRFGVESGDDYITTKILDRLLELDDIRMAFKVLRKHGIHRWSYNIVGLPEESLKLALKTIQLNAEIDPELAIPFIFYPYPGTALFDLCQEKGYLTDKEFDHYFQGVATRMPGFSEGDILFSHRFFRSLISVYQVGNRWPETGRRRWVNLVNVFLTSPLLPRHTIVKIHSGYKNMRHNMGEFLVHRSPGIYKLLGGTDPV